MVAKEELKQMPKIEGLSFGMHKNIRDDKEDKNKEGEKAKEPKEASRGDAQAADAAECNNNIFLNGHMPRGHAPFDRLHLAATCRLCVCNR